MRIPRSPKAHPTNGSVLPADALPAASGRPSGRYSPLLPRGLSWRFGIIAGLAIALLVGVIIGRGQAVFSHTQDFLDYGAGVLALVCLTATALWGLAATDRWLLQPLHRLIAQGVHRATAVSGLGFLALHIWIKVARGETGPISPFFPFYDSTQPFLIGIGTVASYMFVLVASAGALRSAFATPSRARWWRALHMCAYPAWGAALVHGLKAGRAPAGWVTVGYALCLIGVAVALALRLIKGRQGSPIRSPHTPSGESPTDTYRPPAPLPITPSQRPVGLLGQGDHAPTPQASLDRPQGAWPQVPPSYPLTQQPHQREPAPDPEMRRPGPRWGDSGKGVGAHGPAGHSSDSTGMSWPLSEHEESESVPYEHGSPLPPNAGRQRFAGRARGWPPSGA